MTEQQLPAAWQRAFQRARTNHLKAVKVNETLFAVRSVSHPGTMHLVTLEAGKIAACDCPGWRGRRHPCQHAGACGRRLMREAGVSPRPLWR
jgi:hypothetical protein